MSEEKSETDVQKQARIFAEAMKQVMTQAQNPQSEWLLASQPFKTQVESEKKEQVIKPSIQEGNKKELVGFQTYTFLDKMFLNEQDKSIEGIPFGSSVICTGLPNSGKSLLLEEIALQITGKNKKVVYITSEEIFHAETPRFDLESRMRQKAKILGLDWNVISQNLFVLDLVRFAEMREWSSLISTLRSLIEKEKIEVVLIDSLSMVEDNRNQIKYRLTELVRYFQTWGITSIMINQRSMDEPDSFSMAGNIGISHIADIIMVLDYKKAWSGDGTLKLDTGCKQGDIVYFFRILKNRMSKYKANYFSYSINPDGLIRLTKTDSENHKPIGMLF